MWAVGCIMGELLDGQPMFPGESEIDQLYIIQKVPYPVAVLRPARLTRRAAQVLGPLTGEQHEAFLKNPRFLGLKFPDMTRPETLERKYAGKASKKALALMKGLLAMDPAGRLSGHEILQHPCAAPPVLGACRVV
jgi:cyclin-dependent kinase-like